MEMVHSKVARAIRHGMISIDRHSCAAKRGDILHLWQRQKFGVGYRYQWTPQLHR